MVVNHHSYEIHYPRTDDWWEGYDSDGGRWRAMATWLNECVGKCSEHGEWNYLSEYFVFANERDYLLFKLKWHES